MAPVNSGSPGIAGAPKEYEMPLLAALAGVIRWFEELVALLSGPLLTIGLAIALVDLLTGGDLLRAIPALLFTWAACQAVGIDSQLVATFDKLRRALRERRWWAVFGLLSLGVMLGYVGFLSAEAFGFQHAFGVTEAQALARLGIDPISWQLQRAVLAVFLVALSGFTRYHAPAKDYSARAADEAERLRHEIALAPLRAQANAAKLRGVRTAVAAGLGRDEQPTHTGNKPAQPAYAVASTLPPMPQEEHHLPPVAAQKAMHDWDIPDEVEDDSDPYRTQMVSAISGPTDTTDSLATEMWSRARADSGSLDDSFDQFLAEYDGANEGSDDDDFYDSVHRQRKRKNKKVRAGEAAKRVAENTARRNALTRAVDMVMDEALELGENLTDRAMLERVNEALLRAGERETVLATAQRYQTGWRNKHRHSSILSRNPENSRELEPAW